MTELTEVALWKKLREGSLSTDPVMVRSKGYAYGGSDPVIIPPDINEVPANITFRGDVVCNEGILTAFHATVQGAAKFKDLPLFSTLSASAQFREVTVVNCPLTTFEAQTTERADFYNIQNLHLGRITLGQLELVDCTLLALDAQINGNARFFRVVFPKSGMGATFNGSVKIIECDIQEFDLPVNGDLRIRDTKLQTIGAKAVIKGDLYLKDVNLGVSLNCKVGKVCYMGVSQWELGPDARIKWFALDLSWL